MNRIHITIFSLICLLSSNSVFAQNNELVDKLIKYYRHYYPESKDDKSMAISLEGRWKFQIGNDERWASDRTDDSDWVTIHVPDAWEGSGFNGYDGYAWYRITFDGKRLNKNEIHYLNLGFIDDVDAAYINGELVGKSGKFPPKFRTAYNSEREYFIDNALINFNGQNMIAVQVYDEYQSGGIVRGDPGIYVSDENNWASKPLNGLWKFRKNDVASAHDPTLNDQDWENITVPAHWDNQGYRSFDGVAWYRKSFTVDFNYDKNETYYLVLGQIDDFDITYLNGEQIGETNDRRKLGESHSYQVPRVYEIPNELFNLVGENIISVRVRDIGQDGGIYNGPIGIMTKNEIRSLDY